MLIHIQTQELEEQFINPVKNGFVSHPSIDYQTNAVHALYEGKDVIIFNFKKYGWLNDNRFNTYNLSLGLEWRKMKDLEEIKLIEDVFLETRAKQI